MVFVFFAAANSIKYIKFALPCYFPDVFEDFSNFMPINALLQMSKVLLFLAIAVETVVTVNLTIGIDFLVFIFAVVMCMRTAAGKT